MAIGPGVNGVRPDIAGIGNPAEVLWAFHVSAVKIGSDQAQQLFQTFSSLTEIADGAVAVRDAFVGHAKSAKAVQAALRLHDGAQLFVDHQGFEPKSFRKYALLNLAARLCGVLTLTAHLFFSRASASCADDYKFQRKIGIPMDMTSVSLWVPRRDSQDQLE